MPKIEVWARIGVSMTLDVPDNYTDKDVREAAEKKTKENNPDKEDFKFDGHSYLPANQEGITPDLDIQFDDDIEFDI